MVEHGTENAGVDSSSLSLGTTTAFSVSSAIKLVGNLVECILARELGLETGLSPRPIGQP